MNGPTLSIDLDDFAANLAVVRKRVAPALLMLVVKDDAYGHGLERIVGRARAEGVGWFGSFDVREALRTRQTAGPGARILSWLTVARHEIVAALAADIDLGVGDAGFLEEIAAAAGEVATSARIHLKIDTGLHRNGIRPEEWSPVLRRAHRLQQDGLIRVVGVWSHLAEASDAEDDAARQLFDEAVEAAEAEGFTLEVRHLSASAASFARADFRYDLVRVGAFCYGVRSAGGASAAELGIRPIASLTAPVTAADGHEVTLGVGSLHGLPSSLAGRARIAGHEIRKIDLAQTVVTPWSQAQVGDQVEVFGSRSASATDLGEAIGTVGEEILVRVSPLVPRVYRGS